MWVVGGFCGYGGSVWVRGEWAVGCWRVGVTSFQKIYDHHHHHHHHHDCDDNDDNGDDDDDKYLSKNLQNP